jgi:STE24 endopeptidase
MPLFNKFEPLPDGGLRQAIEDYAARESFPLGGVFTMDGSKRSSKSNAFFTGFGRYRRIVLFDTLVERHTTAELLAVLAHEMGHFKCGHVRKIFAAGVAMNVLMLYLLGQLIGNPTVAAAYRMQETSIYASFVFIMVFFTPLSLVFGVLMNALMRRYEYQADRYAADTLADGAEHLVSGLKRLSVDNLADLTPHPLTVWLHYTHPPLLARIAALRREEHDAP